MGTEVTVVEFMQTLFLLKTKIFAQWSVPWKKSRVKLTNSSVEKIDTSGKE
jgi:hypothetical protein